MEPTRKDYEFFKSHLQEICEGHIGEYVAIKDESVIGYYKSFDEAMDTAAKQFEMGTFIVQQCVILAFLYNARTAVWSSFSIACAPYFLRNSPNFHPHAQPYYLTKHFQRLVVS